MRLRVPSFSWQRPVQLGQANTMVRIADLRRLLMFMCAAIAVPVVAAPQEPVLTRKEAIRQDAAVYAQQHQVLLAEAVRRLTIQEASVPAMDRIAAEFAERLAGISVEHAPEYSIVVLLTGNEPVADRTLQVADSTVPIVYRTGALATHVQAISALRRQ